MTEFEREQFARAHRDFALSLFLIGGIAVWVIALILLFGWVGVLILAGWMVLGVVVGVVFGRCFEEEE